jgi:hypothetical protein
MNEITDAERWISHYLGWHSKRVALSAAEESGTYPDPDDWEASDEEAVELLHWAAEFIQQELDSR